VNECYLGNQFVDRFRLAVDNFIVYRNTGLGSMSHVLVDKLPELSRVCYVAGTSFDGDRMVRRQGSYFFQEGDSVLQLAVERHGE
jgi:hypothetical protein